MSGLKKVVIEVGETEISLSLEEARQLFNDLKEIFKDSSSTKYTTDYKPLSDRVFWRI